MVRLRGAATGGEMGSDDRSQCWGRSAITGHVEDALAAPVILERTSDIRLREPAAQQRFETALRRRIELQRACVERPGLVVRAFRVPVAAELVGQLDELAAHALDSRERPCLLRQSV